MDIRICKLYETILKDIIATNKDEAPIGTKTAENLLICPENVEAYIFDNTIVLGGCATLYKIVAKYDEIDNQWKQEHLIFKGKCTEE